MTSPTSSLRALLLALAIGASTHVAPEPARAQYDGADGSLLDSLERFVERDDSAAAERTGVLRLDTSSHERRAPSAAMIERFRADDDFDYGRTYREPESLWDAFWRWLWEWFNDMLGVDGVTTFWEIVAWVILGAGLILVVWKLIGADTAGLFFRKREEDPASATAIEEDVHGIDYPTQIERAVSAGDYRLATRLHYLRLLRDLSEAGAITWRREKTDLDYARDLAGSPLQPAFERAALLFEYVWYGDFPIDRESYGRIAAVIDGVPTSAVEARR